MSTNGRSRRRLGVLAGASVVVLLATTVVLGGSAGRSVRLGWSLGSLAATAVLTGALVSEVVRRLRDEGARGRADGAVLAIVDASRDEEDLVRRTPGLLQRAADGVAGTLGAASATVALSDGTTATSSTAPPSPGPVTWGAAGLRLEADLLSAGERVGSVQATASPGRTFDRTDRATLDHMASRLAGYVQRERLADGERLARQEADHARRQITLLARASASLGPALENPAEAVADIGDLVVPDFADLFAVDVVATSGQLERIVAVYGTPALGEAFVEHRERFPHWQDAHRRVMADGISELVFRPAVEDDEATCDDHGGLMRALDLQSWVVAPVRVRGTSLGTMTLATRRGRRGYRPSDQATIDDLVARSAIAFERGLLYAEARQAALDASRRADQLARMVDASIVLTRTLAPTAVLEAVVEQAASVLEAPHATVTLDDPVAPSIHRRGAAIADPVGVSSPLVDRLGEPVGRLTVERQAGRPFGVDDEAVIRLLAESTSAAHRNAVLYRDVQAREQRLEALIEASPLAILELDHSGEVQVANPAARALFAAGGDPDRVEPPVELARHLDERLADLRRGASGPALADLEVTTADHGGSRRHLWVSTARVGSDAGSARMLAVINDMTSHKRLEEDLAAAQRYEAIATLAGGVAHDFNNLLTVILGYSEILLHGMGPDDADREPVQAIQEAGNHAAVITNQLLALSRHQVLQPETIEAAERCTALLPMLRRLAGPTVEVVGDIEGSGRIRVDPGQLEQVLFNLVFNSRDAMPGGGHLTVRVADDLDAGGDPVVVVQVTDDGEGMDAETLARCQEPFFTTKGRSRGIGLGLATVASILDRSGATLRMTSEPGQGTSSTVVFPQVDGGDPGGPAPDAPRANVLLVDDDEGVRTFAARVLSRGGYAVTEVSDGAGAISRAELDGPFDVLVTDVMLPGMSGFDVVRAMRARWPAMACVVVTGFSDTPADESGLERSVLVPKPFTPAELLRATATARETAVAR